MYYFSLNLIDGTDIYMLENYSTSICIILELSSEIYQEKIMQFMFILLLKLIHALYKKCPISLAAQYILGVFIQRFHSN